MTNQYERDMLEKLLELSANTDSCLLNQSLFTSNLSRPIRRKTKPKKIKGAKYFFQK